MKRLLLLFVLVLALGVNTYSQDSAVVTVDLKVPTLD